MNLLNRDGEKAIKNALPEMKWRQDLMLMIYEVAITKKLLGSDLIDKILEHEHAKVEEAKAEERKRCLEEIKLTIFAECWEYPDGEDVISYHMVLDLIDQAISAITNKDIK